MPDDWDSYYKRCRKCGHIYHASEIGCPCEDEDEEEARRHQGKARN